MLFSLREGDDTAHGFLSMTRFGHSLQVLPQVNTIVDARYLTVDFSALNYQHSNNQNTSTYLPTSNDAPICLEISHIWLKPSHLPPVDLEQVHFL